MAHGGWTKATSTATRHLGGCIIFLRFLSDGKWVIMGGPFSNHMLREQRLRGPRAAWVSRGPRMPQQATPAAPHAAHVRQAVCVPGVAAGGKPPRECRVIATSVARNAA